MSSSVKRAGNVAVPRSNASSWPGEQCRRRAAVLRVRRPRSSGQLGGDGEVAVDLEHVVGLLGHDGSGYAGATRSEGGAGTGRAPRPSNVVNRSRRTHVEASVFRVPGHAGDRPRRPRRDRGRGRRGDPEPHDHGGGHRGGARHARRRRPGARRVRSRRVRGRGHGAHRRPRPEGDRRVARCRRRRRRHPDRRPLGAAGVRRRRQGDGLRSEQHRLGPHPRPRQGRRDRRRRRGQGRRRHPRPGHHVLDRRRQRAAGRGAHQGHQAGPGPGRAAGERCRRGGRRGAIDHRVDEQRARSPTPAARPRRPPTRRSCRAARPSRCRRRSCSPSVELLDPFTCGQDAVGTGPIPLAGRIGTGSCRCSTPRTSLG